MTRPFTRLLALVGAAAIVLYYVNVMFGIPGGEGFRAAPTPYVGGLLALILLYFVYVAISGDVAIWNAAVGEDGRASTSKFQILLWTMVVIFGYVAIATHRLQLGLAAPLPGLPESVLLALGISVGTATAAAAVTANNVNSGRDAKIKVSNQGLAPIVQSDEGMPSLSKIQLVAWTIVGIGIFLAALAPKIALIPTDDLLLANLDPMLTLPDIDATLLVLMGLGSAAYIGGKLVPSTSPQMTSTSVPSAKPGDAVVIKGTRFGFSGYVQIGDAMLQSGLTWSDTEITLVIPDTKPDGSQWAFDTAVPMRVFGSLGQSVNSIPLIILRKT